MTAARAITLDEHGIGRLDGDWAFYPGDADLAALDDLQPETIRVPGLWEAQGHLELDGTAWYRLRFTVPDIVGWWSLIFGAVMDTAEVWLNGVRLGEHDNPFTPFTVDPTSALRDGENDLAVRVTDPAVNDPEHIRLAHGKQGWANHVFPSRPSLYMTYGGIWQPVRIRRHGPVVISDAFVNSDARDLSIRVTVENRGDEPVSADVAVRAVGQLRTATMAIEPGADAGIDMRFGPTTAERWSPEHPRLHIATVDVSVDGEVSDACATRFGLRTVAVEGTRIVVNGVPYRMKSTLVQGFRADSLYAEGDRAQIEDEVRAARAMGFNTLRLHIKAFDPTYLDVCDELGMLLHCDIPVAEPIAHEELGADGESVTATRSVRAVRAQVQRDRNHPSIILWSVMNELCLDRIEARAWDRYERFARALVAAAKETDATRPVIENDWVEPDPDRVFAADVLTAHWYGRLHAEYLLKIEDACRQWRDLDRPLYVTEFGDWGLPQMPAMPEPPFWDTRGVYATGLANTKWPASIARFVTETQRYQGISDRLQAEVFRRHDHIGGYCLTELTDVPHELNGLLDLHRQPKTIAVAEITRVNQTVLPMLELDSLVVVARSIVDAPAHVANDGPDLADLVLESRFGERRSSEPLGDWPAYHAGRAGRVLLEAPHVPGSHDLVVRLRSGDAVIAENRYTLHVVAAPSAEDVAVRTVPANESLTRSLQSVGARRSDDGVLLVAEGGLDGDTAGLVADELRRGQTVVVLAQPIDNAGNYPIPVKMHAMATEWGSSVFHFTTDNGALPSFPRRNVLVAEDSTVQAASVVTLVEDEAFPATPVVIAYKPVPGAITGTVVGSHPVGRGRLVFCQYRLTRAAAEGDAAALALLADVLRWAAVPRRLLQVERSTLGDGRQVARYNHSPAVGR